MSQFILYDGRAIPPGNTDDAEVLSVADSLKEARRDATMFGYALAIYEYDVKEINGKSKIINERFIESYPRTSEVEPRTKAGSLD